MSVLVGGAARNAYVNINAAQSRFTLLGDSLTNAATQVDRMAHGILKNWQFGGSITAIVEPRVGQNGTASDGFLDHNSYESGDTNLTANTTADILGGNSYANYGDFVSGTPEEYFGIPLEGYNWFWDGTLDTVATYVARDLTRTANPISGSVNTFTLVGLTAPHVVFRWIYFGATGLRSTYTATGALERRNFTTGIPLVDRVDPTVDVRPYWSEGDNPETDVSARTGGVKLGEANALWPDLVSTNGLSSVGSYYSDKEGTTPSSGNYNKLGIMAFQATSAANKTWAGGVQFEIVGASSWSLAGFGLDVASSVSLQKTFDNDNWLYFRDVTTISRSIPGTFVVIVDPEAVTAASAKASALGLIDKVTAADAAIGNPVPTVLFVIWPKTSARSVSEMNAWRDGIIEACQLRINAGWVNLYDYYGQAHPTTIDTDGTHPESEAAADTLADDILALLAAAPSSGGSTSTYPGIGLGMGMG